MRVYERPTVNVIHVCSVSPFSELCTAHSTHYLSLFHYSKPKHAQTFIPKCLCCSLTYYNLLHISVREGPSSGNQTEVT